MKARNTAALALLALWAAWIWQRDTRWLNEPEDALAVIVALPLFFFLGRPWKLVSEPAPMRLRFVGLAVAATAAGIASGFEVLLAIGWTAGLWAWIESSTLQDDARRAARLLALPILAFPWVGADLVALGWGFRWSGAWAAASSFSALGLGVVRDGTNILVQGLPLSVDPSCSGLHSLQALLLAGAVVTALGPGKGPTSWRFVPLALGVAWVANTIRVMVLCAGALSFGAPFASGPAHQIAGLVVLALVFLVYLRLLRMRGFGNPEPTDPSHTHTHTRVALADALPALAILVYCAWQAADLLRAWQASPYDRLGWVALAVWLAAFPALRFSGGRKEYVARGPSPVLAGGALVLAGLGTMGSLNVLQHLGLACALAAWLPVGGTRRAAWLLASLAWMPVFGWMGSRLFPLAVLPVRLVVTAAAASFAARSERAVEGGKA